MSAAAAARSILKQLHEVMASRTHAQRKLNQVVEIIGEALDSEVCSIYLLREGMLELFATRGLEQTAVHVTKLAVGTGLTGTIAQNIETLNLAEAGDVDRGLLEPPRREQFEHALAKQVDRADLAIERLADDVDDLVQLALRRDARGHQLVELRQDRACGSGGGHHRPPIASCPA